MVVIDFIRSFREVGWRGLVGGRHRHFKADGDVVAGFERTHHSGGRRDAKVAHFKGLTALKYNGAIGLAVAFNGHFYGFGDAGDGELAFGVKRKAFGGGLNGFHPREAVSDGGVAIGFEGVVGFIVHNRALGTLDVAYANGNH